MSLIPSSLSRLSHLDMLPGQQVEFVLPEPASTGALWRIERQEGVEASLLHDIPVDDLEEQARIIVGGMGRVRLVIRAPTQPIDGFLRLELGRPWENSPQESFSLRIIVSPTMPSGMSA